MTPHKIIFACIHNAGRSQMAAAFFNAVANADRARAISAGTQPAEHAHPAVVEVMREVGIDLSQAKPQRLTDDLANGAMMLITMGCGEQCPVVPGARREDWLLPDPKGQSLEVLRDIRDTIKRRVEMLIHAEGWEQ